LLASAAQALISPDFAPLDLAEESVLIAWGDFDGNGLPGILGSRCGLQPAVAAG